jgi:tetratricopeptide (TPR) repeat protein
MGTRQSVAVSERHIHRFAQSLCAKFLICLSFGFLAETAYLPSAEARSPLSDIAGENEAIESSNEQGQQREIIERVREDLATILPLKGGEGTEIASLLDTIGVFFISIGDTESAIRALEGALHLRERQYGLEHPLTINTLGHLGAARRRAGQPEEALLNLDRALTAARALYGPSTAREAEILVNRSSVFLARGQADEALKDAKTALAEIGDSGDRRLQAAGLANKAVALSQLGMRPESEDAIAEAEKIATNDRNASNSSSLLLADVMTSKGLVEAQNGDQNAAWASVGKAQEIYTSALGDKSARVTKLGSLDGQKSSWGKQNSIRGTLESVDGHMLSVKTARGTDSIKLADDGKVFLVSPADLGAIKDGKFVGITSVEKGGKRVAVEVHVFDESLRRLGEGHYPWDLGSGPNMMTNADIAQVEAVGGERVLKLDYKGDTQKIAVPPDATVVEYTASTPDQLKRGAKAFLIARMQPDGKLVSSAIIVGKDGLKPPM